VTSVLPGPDLERLGAWFAAEIPDAGGALTATLIAGGKSNLTFLVTTVRASGSCGVRPSAMCWRRRMTWSASTGPCWRCATPPCRCRHLRAVPGRSRGGRRVLRDGRCAGTPFRRAGELAVLGPERTRAISTGLVDTLVALLQVDAEDPPFLLKLAPRGAVIAPAHRGIARGVSRRTRSATHRPLPG
jgi:hypothetical protein